MVPGVSHVPERKKEMKVQFRTNGFLGAFLDERETEMLLKDLHNVLTQTPGSVR